MSMLDQQHVYHANESIQKPTISVKAEHNSRGYNYEASVVGASSVEEAMRLLQDVMQSLARVYGKREEK